LEKPLGKRRKRTSAWSRVWTRSSPERERRGALVADEARTPEGVKPLLAYRAAVADSLDVEQTSVGSKADLPECGKVVKPPAYVEVASVVDGGLGSQGAAFLVILLDPRGLVVHVEGRIDALGDDAGAESPGSDVGALTQDPAFEDQLHLIGTADVEVLADDLLEEDAPHHRPVEDLRQRELHLKDRQVVSDARGAVLGREEVGQPAKPLADRRVDLLR
jgi:hypothetical protein